MPSEESLPHRLHWRPGHPRSWTIESTAIDLDASIQRLIIVSDLHAYREPLEAVDLYLGELTDQYRVFVNGDLFEGGVDAAATVEWVRRHATGRTTRGNHDSRVFAYRSNQVDQDPPSQWAPDGELGSYETLGSDQVQFVADLPDQLMVRWRDKKICVLHGHQNAKDTNYTSWRSTVDQLMDTFHDTGVDLTVISHTHYPFVRERDGSWLANCGSVSVPICRFRTADGAIENRCAEDDSVSSDDAQCSFLNITESGGALDVQIVRFDYDRRGMLDRYSRHDGLSMSPALRERWILQAFHGT
ncbi:MAG TPA: hypothetical protein DIT01_04140 [Lentisphaeria bacterium]|nr:hypothetical protein [Lentisphaeria bacterium]